MHGSGRVLTSIAQYSTGVLALVTVTTALLELELELQDARLQNMDVLFSAQSRAAQLLLLTYRTLCFSHVQQVPIIIIIIIVPQQYISCRRCVSVGVGVAAVSPSSQQPAHGSGRCDLTAWACSERGGFPQSGG